MAPIRIARAEFAVAPDAIDTLARFYGEHLGLEVGRDAGRVSVSPGADVLDLVADPDAVGGFPHFAFLVPGDRFEVAHDWLAERTEVLLKDGEPVVEFGFWDARAVYFHDPVGNIVELIAHRGLREAEGAAGPFDPAELAGMSEAAVMVEDLSHAVAALERLGLEHWGGDRERLAFVGAKARTLVVCAVGRELLPTGRPAEAHGVSVTISGVGAGDQTIELGSAPARRVRRTA